MRLLWLGLVAVVAGAQGPLAELRQMYSGVKNNILRMAEKMPEEHYAFKPVPEIRSFGELMAHIADSQARNCSSVLGEVKQLNAASKTRKEDLVAALKESFQICDQAYESLTEDNARQMVKGPRGERSKAGLLVGNLSHSNEEYGYGAVYLRLKGIVPPSSERR